MIATFVRSVTIAYLPSGENSSMPGDSSNGIDFTIFRVDGSTMISALGPSMSTPDQLCDGEGPNARSEEHTSELQSHSDLVCRLLLEKKKKNMHDVSDQQAGR